MDSDQRLGPITLALGASEGYSGDDLTNVRNAALAGEVPYLALDGSTRGADPVLELRIHGVGGAPPSDNLESPATLQVAGDATAGFHRAWYPGGTARGRPRREAYCWGGLNTRANSRAFYLLLIAFMLINVAHWALPGRPGPNEPLLDKVARAALRLVGLALTVAFFATTVTLLGDLVAWQAPVRGGLPSWLGWYGHRDTGPRLAMSLLAVLLVLGGLMWLSFRTVKSYERWGADPVSDDDPDWPLSRPSLWRGERTVNRQRNVHVIAVSGVVLMFAALPHSSVNPLRVTLLVFAAVLGATAAILIASPWTDRLLVGNPDEMWSDVVCVWVARFGVALAASVSFARFWWRVQRMPDALPGDQIMLACTTFAEYGLIVVLLVLVLIRAPWRLGREVMGFGLAGPLLATLAVTIGSIFGESLTLAIGNLIGTPKVTTAAPALGGKTLLMPSTVYVGGVGMVVALVAAVLTAGYFLGWARWEGRRLGRTGEKAPPDSVEASNPEPGGAGAALTVGQTWARSSLTDRAAAVLTAITLPTALVLVVDLICLQSNADWKWLQRIAGIGGTIGVAATLYFLASLRSALTDASKRHRFGFIWDVGTFWPRACHPFGPPSYAERAVPEVVTRIRRLVGDEIRHGADDPALAQEDAERRDQRPDDPLERQGPLLLTGYSQGTPISIAVVAQLPQAVRARMAMLTLAAPIRRLYGRAFPAYFGPDDLTKVLAHLTEMERVRWRNLVRRSDYIGGYAFNQSTRAEAHALVDRYIYDPPTLWLDADPSPPPMHLHSDWFPDPQTRRYAVELMRMLA